MTVSTLSMNNSFKFDAFTELLTSLSVFFRGLGNTQIQRIRSEDDATALQLKRKFEFDDPPPPPPYPVDTIADNLNIEPEEISEKIKHDDGDNVEPTLETASKIENSNTQRKFDKVWLDNFLNRVKTTKQVLQELNDQVIVDLLYEELNAPTTTQIDPIFIDDNDVFSKDDLTDENKELIKTLLDNSNYFFDNAQKDDQQELIQTDLSNTQLTGDATTDEINFNNWLNTL